LTPRPLEIEIKTEEQITVMRNTCRLARKILDCAGRQLKASGIKVILFSSVKQHAVVSIFRDVFVLVP
jgi:methionine aminopeptidase